MAKLSKEEADQLAALQAKADAPDDPEPGASRHEGRNVDIYVDLSDESAVTRAIKLGLLTEAEAAPDPDPDPDPDPEPTRRPRFA